MLIHRRIVRPTAKIIANAADGALTAYREERVGGEDDITGRMLGAIEQEMQNRRINGVLWTSKTLKPHKGRSDEERRHGADFLGVLDVDLSDYKVKKGFLAQAKRTEPNEHLVDWDRLVRQSRTMLERTPDAFIFVYSRRAGIRVLPAVSVIGADTKTLLDLYNHSVSRFFEDHLKSFIGDPRLSAPTIDLLDALAHEFDAHRVLYLAAREDG